MRKFINLAIKYSSLRSIYLGFMRSLLWFFPISGRIRDLLMWPIASRIIGTDYQETVMLPNGLMLTVTMGDQLGRMGLFYGKKTEYFWEPVSVQLLEALAKDAKIIVMAGAHIGYVVLMACKAMKRESNIYTFEPVTELYSVAKQNIDRSCGKQCILVRAALGRENRMANINIDGLRSSINEIHGKRKEKVTLTTLDTFTAQKAIQNIDLLFLDIEGAEEDALHGARQIFSKGVKNFIFEVVPRIHDWKGRLDRILQLLAPYGYRYFIIDDTVAPEVSISREKILLLPLESHLEKYADCRNFNVLATKETNSTMSAWSSQIIIGSL